MARIVREVATGYTLRFERHLEHPVDEVWAALTEPGRLAKWLAPGEIELRQGGRVQLRPGGGATVIEGTVTAVEPPRLLEYTWPGLDGDAGPVRLELLPEEGGTGLVLTHTVRRRALARLPHFKNIE